LLQKSPSDMMKLFHRNFTLTRMSGEFNMRSPSHHLKITTPQVTESPVNYKEREKLSFQSAQNSAGEINFAL